MNTSKLGGKNSAKRMIQIRNFFKMHYTRQTKYSSPFLSDDESPTDENSEPELSIGNLSFLEHDDKENLLKNSNPNPDVDEILRRPNLDDAAKFISTLKFKKEKPSNDDELIPPHDLDVSFQDLSLLYQNEVEKLDNLRKSEAFESPQIDDYLI